MTEFFLNFFSGIDKTLGGIGVFLISLSVLTGVFISLLIILLTRCYENRVRFCFTLLLLFVPIAERSIEEFLTGGKYFLFTFAFFLIYSAILWLIPDKKIKISKKQKELARFLDDCAKGCSVKNDDEEEKALESIKTVCEEERVKYDNDLDFSHVKNILSRMEYYNLTPNDKRQVKDLECAINQGEVQLTPSLKEKINDGLGALLKIMSKYGI
ncbi:MAG: hypothetical protein J6C62_09420 [Clostridia bacterium]|nr:hypothetical protein [Clostridia bacterium]